MRPWRKLPQLTAVRPDTSISLCTGKWHRPAPPDLNSNHQKAFVPRAALTAVEVLAVVPARGAARRRPAAPAQPRLFNP